MDIYLNRARVCFVTKESTLENVAQCACVSVICPLDHINCFFRKKEKNREREKEWKREKLTVIFFFTFYETWKTAFYFYITTTVASSYSNGGPSPYIYDLARRKFSHFQPLVASFTGCGDAALNSRDKPRASFLVGITMKQYIYFFF